MNTYNLLFKGFISLLFAVILNCFTGCKKLLDPGLPSNRVVTPQVYSNDSLATEAVINIYSNMMKSFGLFNGDMSRYVGLQSDELDRTSFLLQDQPFLANLITTDNATVKEVWNSAYSYIYLANDAIQGLTGSTTVTAATRKQLLGEAYFWRAFTYFYLVNLYGDVPLVLTTDYTKSAVTSRTASATVYEQVITDLKQAVDLLPFSYVTTPAYPTQRIRINKGAVLAMLARVCLYQERWNEAEAAAAEVIQSGTYQLAANMQQTFLTGSNEAILQLMSSNSTFNTAEGAIFVPVSPVGKPAFILTDSLLNHFETGDIRRNIWIRSVVVTGKPYNSPYKYKVNFAPSQIEYNMVLRLAEQYLIRAEARAMQNKFAEAANDLNTIRARAGLPNVATFSSLAQALAAIEQERRIELFAEWGHRWFDLKRWPARSIAGAKRVDEVMSALRPATWKTTSALWPVPSIEIDRNPSLTQNPGY